VSDTYTGLVWQQAVPASTYTWTNAQSYCAGLLLNNYFWRLPTLEELESLVDRTVPPPGPMINQTAFPNTPADWFWTSSPSGLSGYPWWGLHFGYGYWNSFEVGDIFRVRCVR